MHTTATDGQDSSRKWSPPPSPRPEVHRHHRSLEARHDGPRPRRRAAAASSGTRSTRSTRSSNGIRGAQGHRVRHPRKGRHGPARRRARRGRLGDRQHPLRPEAAAGSRSPSGFSARSRTRTSTCIAHPTGRLINRREPYDVDLDAVFAAAKKHGKLLELNANPARLDLDDVHCAAAKAHGIPIVINTDAHSTRPRRDALRHPASPPRRPDEGRRGEHAAVEANCCREPETIARSASKGEGREIESVNRLPGRPC